MKTFTTVLAAAFLATVALPAFAATAPAPAHAAPAPVAAAPAPVAPAPAPHVVAPTPHVLPLVVAPTPHVVTPKALPVLKQVAKEPSRANAAFDGRGEKPVVDGRTGPKKPVVGVPAKEFKDAGHKKYDIDHIRVPSPPGK